MNFNDYLASEITPQDTLLQKLNKIIKFLKEEKHLYEHRLDISTFDFYFYSTDSEPIDKKGSDLSYYINTNALFGIGFVNHMGTLYPAQMSYNGSNTLVIKYTNFTSFESVNFDSTAYTDIVKEIL